MLLVSVRSTVLCIQQPIDSSSRKPSTPAIALNLKNLGIDHGDPLFARGAPGKGPMETVTFSCLVCFKPIENNAGSVLSCGHFICDKCAIQPERCPVCNEECAAQSLLSADEEVKGYLMAPDQVINRAQAVSGK